MNRSNRYILPAILLIPVSLFLYLNYLELRFEEPRRAVVALEMILSGDYIVPRINGAVYFNKPPFFNWMIIGLFRLFGSYQAWLVRLPSLVSLLVMTGVLYLFAKKYLGRAIAVLASLLLITSGDIYFFETLISGEIDLFYAMIVFLQVVAIYHFYQTRNYLLLFVLSYLLTAIGVLTKGLPSFLFQGLTLLLVAIWQKDKKLLFRWQHVAGLVVLLLVAGGYFLAYSRSAALQPFLINLFAEAKSKSGLGEKQHAVPISVLTFPLQLAKFLLPWSVLFLLFVHRGLRRYLRNSQLLVFCMLFFVVNIPPYWITGSVKSRYIFMFYPFICTLLAAAWFFAREHFKKAVNGIEWFFLVFMILAALSFAVGPFLTVTAGIQLIALKSLPFFVILAWLCYRFRKEKEQRIFVFVLFVVLLRIGFAFYYFPVYEDREGGTQRKDYLARSIDTAAGHQPVYLAGDTVSLDAKAALGPLVFSEATIKTPPYIGYGIPFYYARLTGHAMEYRNDIAPGNCYLVYAADITDSTYRNREVSVLYRCSFDKKKPELALIRVKN